MQGACGAAPCAAHRGRRDGRGRKRRERAWLQRAMQTQLQAASRALHAVCMPWLRRPAAPLPLLAAQRPSSPPAALPAAQCACRAAIATCAAPARSSTLKRGEPLLPTKALHGSQHHQHRCAAGLPALGCKLVGTPSGQAPAVPLAGLLPVLRRYAACPPWRPALLSPSALACRHPAHASGPPPLTHPIHPLTPLLPP